MNVTDIRDASAEQWRPGVETRMLVAAKNGARQLCIFEQLIAPGAGAPTHSHRVEEVLTVRDGEAEMWLDDERISLSAGQSLIVPPGCKHGFRNSGGNPMTGSARGIARHVLLRATLRRWSLIRVCRLRRRIRRPRERSSAGLSVWCGFVRHIDSRRIGARR